DAAAVEGAGDGAAEFGVDAESDALGIGELGFAQQQGERGEVAQVGGEVALGDGAIGNASYGGVVELLAGPGASGGVAADDERTLGGGVDLTVFSAQGGEQEGSAVERFGVADGGDDYVHLRAGAGEGGHGGGDGDGGDVFDGDGGGGNLEAHTQQDVGEHLGGEDGLLLVSGAAQADAQAVAHEGA